MDNFGQTCMGQEFYEGTMKSINKNLGRIADALEVIVKGQAENTELLKDNNEVLNKIQETLTYLR